LTYCLSAGASSFFAQFSEALQHDFLQQELASLFGQEDLSMFFSHSVFCTHSVFCFFGSSSLKAMTDKEIAVTSKMAEKIAILFFI
jgi:hypothetical protein